MRIEVDKNCPRCHGKGTYDREVVELATGTGMEVFGWCRWKTIQTPCDCVSRGIKNDERK